MLDFGLFPGRVGLDIGPATIKILALCAALYQLAALLAGVEGYVFSVAMRIYVASLLVFGALFSVLGGLLGAYFRLPPAGWAVVGVLVVISAHFAAEAAIRRYWEDWRYSVIAMVFTFTAFPALIWGYFFRYHPHGFVNYYTGPSAPFAWGVTIAGIILGVVVLRTIKWVYPPITLLLRCLALGVAAVLTLHPHVLTDLWQAMNSGGGSLEAWLSHVWRALLRSGGVYAETVAWFFAGGLALALYASWVNRFRKGSFVFFHSLESAREGFLTVGIARYVWWGLSAAASTLGRMLVFRRLPLGERPLFQRIRRERCCGPAVLAYLDENVRPAPPAGDRP